MIFYCGIFLHRRGSRHNCDLDPNEQTPITPQLYMAQLLEEEAINSIDYEFSFQLEIRAPYLLAGQRHNIQPSTLCSLFVL
jgi:hypothetical protein